MISFLFVFFLIVSLDIETHGWLGTVPFDDRVSPWMKVHSNVLDIKYIGFSKDAKKPMTHRQWIRLHFSGKQSIKTYIHEQGTNVHLYNLSE